MFASCKKDDKDKGPQAPTYATKEEGKGMLQTAAIDYTQTMAELSAGDFFTASMQLARLMSMDEESSEPEMRIEDELLKSDVLGLGEGIYTWNGEEFTITEHAEPEPVVKILFPYSDESAKNDCELVLTYDATENEDATIKLPVLVKGVNSTMTVSGKEVFNLKGNVTYSKNGEPTLSTGTVTIEDLNMC